MRVARSDRDQAAASAIQPYGFERAMDNLGAVAQREDPQHLVSIVPGLLQALSDDVTIRVAVHDEPLRGKDTAGFLFGVPTQELTPFELVQEIVEEDNAVVLFETSLRRQRAHGLNVVEYGADGLVEALTAFFRPLPTLQLIAEVIGGHMAQRFGPPESMA